MVLSSDGNISCPIMYEVTCELPWCCVSQNILFMISQATREFYDSHEHYRLKRLIHDLAGVCDDLKLDTL